MFKARVKMEVLREAVEVISTLVSEVKLSVSKDGIEVKAVDPSHVAMLVLKLKNTVFEEFTGEPTEIGVDVEKIKEVLRLSKPGDLIDLQYDGGKNRLVVSVGKVTRHMSVVDPAGITDPKVPNVNPPAMVAVKMDELRQGIRGSESISDHVTLILEPNGFTMHSEGETDRVDLHIPKDGSGGLSKLEVKESVRSMYPLDFFSSMVKSITSSDEATLHVGNEYPLKIEFSLAGGRGEGRFLLAPRVEED
ncbi:MAG TPA: DNA polymerase sliding clamp [Thermoplasmata archaeon]|nr:DNA polymerase sliding clamp [Thermoplasmata archaeon]